MTDHEPPAAGALPDGWAAELGYAYLARQVALASDSRALRRDVRAAVLTEAAGRLSQVEDLARAVLQLADELGMPDDAWDADGRIQLACAAVGAPEGSRRTHSRLWGGPGEEAGDDGHP